MFVVSTLLYNVVMLAYKYINTERLCCQSHVVNTMYLYLQCNVYNEMCPVMVMIKDVNKISTLDIKKET